MKRVSKEDLTIVLDRHKKWLESNGEDGDIADLCDMDMSCADFSYRDFREVNFSRSDLRHSNFSSANLRKTVFHKSILGYVEFTNADLSESDLSHSNLSYAGLSETKLNHANLCNAFLFTTNLRGSDLTCADLTNAALFSANFTGANFDKTKLSSTYLAQTVFSLTDLSNAIGLDQCVHMGYSVIDFITLIRSKNLPIPFLRACGLPKELINYLPSLAVEAVGRYSCFISYSSKDQEFASLLHKNLENKGIRCWYAPHDLRIGSKIRPTLDEQIQVHDKLLLILSSNSINSDWVEQEVETALARERENKGTVLFPIRIDDDIMKVRSGWPSLIKNTRHIGDFLNWKKDDTFQRAFYKLLSDIQSNE